MTAKTTTERQKSRRNKLNQIAQDAGYETWTKYETSIIKKGVIKMDARELYENDNKKFWQIVTEMDSRELTDDGNYAPDGWMTSLDENELIERVQNALDN